MSPELTIDSLELARWQEDPRFDYDRELMGGGQNLLDWLWSTFWEWIDNTFDKLAESKSFTYALIVCCIALVAFILWWVFEKHPSLFMRNDDNGSLDYDTQQDTIYGVDFDTAIDDAVAHGDYRQAVRLVYLQTLKKLSDEGRIDWQPSKTPMQYMRQMDSQPFCGLSRHFIRVRYGNFEATEQLFHEMKGLQAATEQSAESEQVRRSPLQGTSQEKGGEQ